MSNLNKFLKVTVIALLAAMGVQEANAIDTTVAQNVESTKKPFGFATVNSRTANSAYSVTGGGVYTIEDVNKLIEGKAKDETFEADGKKVIVLTPKDGDMAEAIHTAVEKNDIVVFDGANGNAFMVDEQITLRNLKNRTLIGINGAKMETTWHITDIIKSWLNSVETSSGSGVSNASTAKGTGGTIIVAGKEIAINEEAEYLTRKTLVAKGEAASEGSEERKWLATEKYSKAGLLFISGCENFIVRNITFQGPGSVDVGGVDLISVINGTNHLWVDHCEFIDGEDGTFDITNLSDFITVSWCKFYYTERSYVHQNSNLVGSDDDYKDKVTGLTDEGRLNITFANNIWGEKCRARMPMARFGKIHLLNNYYNCADNSEYAINPRLKSEFLIEGNYFEKGVRKVFTEKNSVAYTSTGNTIAEKAATPTSLPTKGTVTVPYTYSKVTSDKVPEMNELLSGAILDIKPQFTVNPEGVTLEQTSTEMEASPVIFSVWAEYTMGYQWYLATKEDLSDKKPIANQTRNSLSFSETTEGQYYLYCEAAGLAGNVKSNVFKVTVQGSSAPIFTTDLKDEYEIATGDTQEFTVEAGALSSYQWYKASSADLTDAVEITGETQNTYSFTTTEQGITYIYCVATNKQGSQNSKVAKVKARKMAQETVLDFTFSGEKFDKDTYVEGQGTADKGCTLAVNQVENTDKNGNVKSSFGKLSVSEEEKLGYYQQQSSDALMTVKFNDGIYLVKGDVIHVFSHETGSSPQAGRAHDIYPALKNSGTPIKTTVTSAEYSGNRFVDLSVEVTEEFAIAANKEGGFCIARNGNGLRIHEIMVDRVNIAEPLEAPEFTTDVNETYRTAAKEGVDIVVSATETPSYQWYGNTTKSTEGGTAIEGATEPAYKFTPTEIGKYYFYCVATNSKGSTTSSIATVEAVKPTALPVTYTWDIANWTDLKSNGKGVAQSFPAKEDRSETISYYGANTAPVSSSSTFDDGSVWTNCFKTGGSSTMAEGQENRMVKYHARNSGMIKVYVKGGTSNTHTLYVNNTPSQDGASKVIAGNTYHILEYKFNEECDIYIGGTSGFYIYAIVAKIDPEAEDVCARPKAMQGAWSGDGSKKWEYTISSETETAHLYYVINNQEEQTVNSNKMTLQLNPGDVVRVQAKDSNNAEGTLKESKVLEFIVPEKKATETPVMTPGLYSVTKHGYEITITGAAEGAKVYYTLDGTTPTDASKLYEAPFVAEAGNTVKAVAIQQYYNNSSVVSYVCPAFTNPGTERIVKANGVDSSRPNVGVSYTVPKFSGAANKLSDGLKYNTNAATIIKSETDEDPGQKGFWINVNEGLVIKKIVAELATSNNQQGTLTLTGVYVDGNTTDNKLENSVVMPFYGGSTDAGALKNGIVIDNIQARKNIGFTFTSDGVKNNQANILFAVEYEVDDAIEKVVIDGQEHPVSEFEDNKVLTVPADTRTYEEDPEVTFVTKNGYRYTVKSSGKDADDMTEFTYTILGEVYTVKAKVTGISSPYITIDNTLSMKGGYKVTLDNFSDGVEKSYISIDDAEYEEYSASKEYYALKSVKTYSTYKENGTEDKTEPRTAQCPENDFEPGKPFAVFVKQEGYSDTGTGQEYAEAYDPAKDQIHKALKEQYNVIDLTASKDRYITETMPEITKAKLVVLSEMIGGSGSYTDEQGVVQTASKLVMSLRDQLVGKVNVINLKMFFYSQSKNNTDRWGWAQPATLAKSVIGIMPRDPMYKVFENVQFEKDGSVALWDSKVKDATLNHLQLVHNYNTENEQLPDFQLLATATDTDIDEVYDALHYFYTGTGAEKVAYVGTGISVNDYTNYEENVFTLVNNIGRMIKENEDLGTVMTTMPAPRVRDQGDGSAIITNNNVNAKTFYLAKAENETPPAVDEVISGGKETADYVTEKFNTDMMVYAVTVWGSAQSALGSALVKGNTVRYMRLVSKDVEAEGKEARVAYVTTDEQIAIPYNTSYRNLGKSIVEWADAKGVKYAVGSKVEGNTFGDQDVTLYAVWADNKKEVTDVCSEETDEQRTVVWNFRRSKGAPEMKLENAEKTGILVGQMHFHDGSFIDVPLVVDVDNTVVLADNGETYTGKFNNASDNYVGNDFAQVRAGTQFTFPAVYGMKVTYKQVDFEKMLNDNYAEKCQSYVSQSTLTDGRLTNPGLALTDDKKIALGDGGKVSVNKDNLKDGGVYDYTGEGDLATLLSLESAVYAAPSKGKSDKVAGTVNYGSCFMESLAVTYPTLCDLTTEIVLPENNVKISEKEEPAVITLSDSKKNCKGRYLPDAKVDVTIKANYSYTIKENGISITSDQRDASNIKIAEDKKSATGFFTMKPGTKLVINLGQTRVHAYKTKVMPINCGSVAISSNTGKEEEEEYIAFAEGNKINVTARPKVGYQFMKWTDGNGVDLYFGNSDAPENMVKAPEGVTQKKQNESDLGEELEITVNENTANITYVAVFQPGIEGTVTYDIPYAGLKESDTKYSRFDLYDEGDDKKQTLFDKYLFPESRTTTALYIPTNYTLFKKGYTLSHWAYIPDFNPNDDSGNTTYDATEYTIGNYYYFTEDVKNRVLYPIFVKNPTEFDYRTTPAEIQWDFRTAYFAQQMNIGAGKEFNYSTHTVINRDVNSDGVTIDVPLHVKTGTKGRVDNTTLDEWCHLGEGTEITIPSGLGATFTLAVYNKLSSTTIDGVVPTDYIVHTENDIPVYYYAYTTPSTATSVKLLIGKDHTYYKSIRAVLPSADKVTLETLVNNEAHGKIEIAGTFKTDSYQSGEDNSNVAACEKDGNIATMPLGTYVEVKVTRNRLFELDYLMLDGEKITLADAQSKGYILTAPEGNGKDYTFRFRLASYASVLEAFFKDKQKYQVSFSAGAQAQGEAPGVIVVEEGEEFIMPKSNQTLYYEGYTLKHWTDEKGNKYEWGKGYTPKADLYLTPVFEINDFTLFDITNATTAKWELGTAKGAPLLKYQKSNGVYVTQLKKGDDAIDLKLDLACLTSGAKVDNSANSARAQINAATIISVPTNSNCVISLEANTSNISTTRIAGATSVSAGTNSTAYTAGQTATVTYTGPQGTQDIEFMGEASYFNAISVTYNKVNKTGLPELDYVTINNIALGSYGTIFQDVKISTLKTDHAATVKMQLSKNASMPVVKAEANIAGAIVNVDQPTESNPVATIIVRTSGKVAVGVYKITFNIERIDKEAPALQKVEMDNRLVLARAVDGTLVNYLEKEKDVRMAVNGTVNVTFNHEMAGATVKLDNQEMEAESDRVLSFHYWGLKTNTEYTFTIPANTLKDIYGNVFTEAITFKFQTASTSQYIVKKNVNFVVTHKQTATFNAADPTANYTLGMRKQVASDDLIANLEKAGIAYGTIDEGIAKAHETSATERFFIFVPDGDYQLRGNATTDAVSLASGYAPADNEGDLRQDLVGKKIYNGVTAIKRDNVSITGQSQEGTHLWNRPEIEGISYTSTFLVNSGVANFYVQDMTLTNAFDYQTSMKKQSAINSAKAARAVVLRDRGSKTIMKNVSMMSYQDTYYSNVINQYNDTRGYFEGCTVSGYVDFFCGDGDHWFQNCKIMLRNGITSSAANIIAPATYNNQKWGYMFKDCEIVAEDATAMKNNDGKMTIARPWKNSPAVSLLDTKFSVLSTTDGYKAMSNSGLVLRMHEYGSKDGNDTPLDLSGRSLRASSPGVGSYSAVMTPMEYSRYSTYNALGGNDGYDPTIYTRTVSMKGCAFGNDDTFLTWEGQPEALCYFIFRKNVNKGTYELFAVTDDTKYEMSDDQIGNTFMVRAANQRGGLGEPSADFVYDVQESFHLTLTDSHQVEDNDTHEMWSWSTVYLGYNAKVPVKSLEKLSSQTAGTADNTEEIFVYAVTGISADKNTINLKRVSVMEGYQGYIVKGKPGEYVFGYTTREGKYHDGTKPSNPDDMSILDGVLEDTPVGNVSAYALNYKATNGLGFYEYKGSVFAANKAYLDATLVDSFVGVPDGATSFRFSFEEDEETSIDGVNGNGNAGDRGDDAVYTIYGQRINANQMRKGEIYIVNGVKKAM